MVLQGSRVAMRVGSQRCAGRGLKPPAIESPSYGRGGIGLQKFMRDFGVLCGVADGWRIVLEWFCKAAE